mmetsp:Transcript_16539/g.49490  ORF Transcript_16539/g.49490 Transcript_16539/m.49490 type:complete len:256 (+) Transcript_16539:4738-5505(+)
MDGGGVLVASLLEGEVAQVQHSRHHAEHCILLLQRDTHQCHAPPRGPVLLGVVDPRQGVAGAAVEVLEGVGGLEAPQLRLLRGCSVTQLVEYVVVALGVIGLHHPGPLQEVRAHRRTANAPCCRELDLHKLSEPRRVIVAHGLGVSKCLQQRIGLQHLLLHAASATGLRLLSRETPHPRQILHDELAGFRLAGTRLTTDQDGLALPESPHLLVRGVSDGVHVWRKVAEIDATVLLHHVGAIKVWQPREGVHSNQN